jgi:GR25 family glycosyltransferase involved in LPS biosynthesis
MEFPCVVIHRSQDKEREPILQELEQKLGFLLQRVEGVDGNLLVAQGFPRKHPHEGFPTTPGNIGCTASHILVLQSALKGGWSHVGIFEDDAVAEGDLGKFLRDMSGRQWDILFFGVNEVVEGWPFSGQPDILQVRRFWGTHAVVVGRRAMEAIMETYKKSIHDGYALPADWLYSWAIRDHGLIALCPSQNLVTQKKGIVSVISGAVRT